MQRTPPPARERPADAEPGNPYAAPQARLALTESALRPDAFQAVRLLSLRGRIGRLRFVLTAIAAYLVMGIGGAVVIPLVTPWGRNMADTIFFLIGAAYLIFMLMLMVQRGHDMNKAGWTVVFALVPLMGLLWVFVPGTPDANRYGLPPPPNSRALQIAGWVVGAVVALGIVAATALPALMLLFRNPA